MSSNTNASSKKGKRTREESSAEAERESKKQKLIPSEVEKPAIPESQKFAEFTKVRILQLFLTGNAILVFYCNNAD